MEDTCRIYTAAERAATDAQMEEYISRRDTELAWSEHKRIACVILHRTLDRNELRDKDPLKESIVENDDMSSIIWRGDALGQLNNIINYLKETLTIAKERAKQL